MEKKKKAGSSLVILLALSMIIVIISGTLVGAISYTRNGNDGEKKNSDLIYAAESGIEMAVSNIDKSAPNFDVDGNGVVDTPTESEWHINLNDEYASKNIEVDVKLTRLDSGAGYNAISTAKYIGTNRKKTVEADIIKRRTIAPGGQNLLEYSICAKKTNIYHMISSNVTNSSFNPELSKINGDSMPNIQYIGTGEGKTFTYTEDQYNDDGFLLPDFKHEQYNGDIEVSSIEALDGKQGVLIEEISLPHGVTGSKIKVYYVNIPEDKNLIINNPVVNFPMDSILICSGNVTIYGDKDELRKSDVDLGHGIQSNGEFIGTCNGQPRLPSLYMSYFTIIANKVNLYISSLDLNYPTFGQEHSHVKESDIDYVNNKIGEHCYNWGSGIGAPSGETWLPIEIEYK